MGTREELLDHLWREVIHLRAEALPNIIANERRDPARAPFTGLGQAIERMLAQGVAPEDLLLVMRHTAYEAVHGTLYALSDPGVDGNEVFGLYEELWTADPSGTTWRRD